MNSTVRWVLLVAGAAGVLFSAVGFFDLIDVIQSNGVTDGEAVGLREHYIQLGGFYTRGFTTGFFLCFSLMLVAIAVGTFYDEKRKARRALAVRMAAGGAVVNAGAMVKMTHGVEEQALLDDSDAPDPLESPPH